VRLHELSPEQRVRLDDHLRIPGEVFCCVAFAPSDTIIITDLRSVIERLLGPIPIPR